MNQRGKYHVRLFSRQHFDPFSSDDWPTKTGGLSLSESMNILSHTASRTAAVRHIQTVGFHLLISKGYPYVHDYTYFGAQYAQRKCPWGAEPVSLLPLASDFCFRVYPQSSLPACRLGFSWAGLESLSTFTHWVTITNFFPYGRIPKVLDLSRHENVMVGS